MSAPDRRHAARRAAISSSRSAHSGPISSSKCRRRRAARPGLRPPVETANQTWAMDFVTVTLADGRRARVLTVLDLFTRESLAVRADARFPGA